MNKRIAIPIVIIFMGVLIYMSVPEGDPNIPDRTLSETHLKYIGNQLKDYKGDKIIITHIIGDKEGKLFAKDIGKVLKVTGWNIEEKTSWNIFETKQGQYIGLNEDGIMEINVFRKGYYEE